MARSTVEGESKRETIRCLKRYFAREVYGILVSNHLPISLVTP